MLCTPYFKERVLLKRPYLTVEYYEAVVKKPVKREQQPENDGITIHNAFLDRGFKP